MLAERLGFKVKLVDCGHDNIKLTYYGDLDRAISILKKREGVGV
jgi:2-C-methyl-D-erythritol 4-phosphate cytidylyltransferase